jgi:hypothetical protein
MSDGVGIKCEYFEHCQACGHRFDYMTAPTIKVEKTNTFSLTRKEVICPQCGFCQGDEGQPFEEIEEDRDE